jgi:YidC/Oxa1 family membrane protein insertase
VETRRLLLAITLSFAVLIVWTYFFPPQNTKLEDPAPAEISAETEAGATPTPGAVSGPGAVPGRPQTVRPATAVPSGPEITATAEQEVVLEGDRLRAVFSNRGAQLHSVQSRQSWQEKGAFTELVRDRVGTSYPFGLTDAALRPHPANDALFTVSRQGNGAVVFRYRGPRGDVEKRFRIDERGLLRAEIRVPGRDDWGVLLGPGLRNPTAEELDSQFERRAVVYSRAGADVQVVEAKEADLTRRIRGAGLRWIGIEDTFFLSALIPEAGVDRAVLQPVLMQPGGVTEGEGGKGAPATYVPMPPAESLNDEQEDLVREYQVVLRPAGDRMALASFWGAKEYDRLAELPYGLEETVAFGSLKFLALPLLASLHWIHDNVVANYGWAIVLMTVVIKLLLLPLTHHSTISMRKMQKLNPKIQAIRDRYRTKLRDKQGKPNLESQRKMNDEVMALYKSEGVNPAGGCLPLLLQMPILFAFYRLLTTAAELRGAPWMLWITDLSVQDPYYVLPVVMGLTQFLQVLLSPQVGDPMQRRLFLFLPLFMTVFFLGFPSGLVLYWLTNSVLTIVQQGVYNRLKTA